MTLIELQYEAEKLGYKLVKRKQTEKFLPCICGCNRRESWYSNNEDWEVKLVCYRCGLSVTGKNEKDAKRKWNEYVRAEKEEVK